MSNKYIPVFIAAALLGLFAVIGTTLVSATFNATADKIAENQRKALLKQLHQLVPAESIDNDITSDTITVSSNLLGAESTRVYLGRKEGKPVAAVFNTIAPDGYSGSIALLVAIRTDATLGGVRIVSHRETPGLGDKIDENKSDWIKQFASLSLMQPEEKKWKVKRDGGYFDQFTGATITPRAVIKAIKNTLRFYQQQGDRLFKSVSTMQAEVKK